MKLLLIASIVGIVSCFIPWMDCDRYLAGPKNALDNWPGVIILLNYLTTLTLSFVSIILKTTPAQKLLTLSSILSIISLLYLCYSLLTGWVFCDIQVGLAIAFLAQLWLIVSTYRLLKD